MFGTITYADNGANMLYSGLQMQVQKRFHRGLMFTSTWVWAKEISDIDDNDDFELNDVIEDTYDRRRDRGNVYSVPRQQWLNNAIYELPFRGRIAGGWQLNMLLNLSTGNWFTPLLSGPDPTNTRQTALRPDLVKPEIPLPHTLNPWFDPSAFATPANGNWGNAGRGIIEGPGYVLFNLGLQKSVRFERWGAVERGGLVPECVESRESGRANRRRVRAARASRSVGNVNAGKITATHIFPPAGSARTGQLGLRWNF